MLYAGEAEDAVDQRGEADGEQQPRDGVRPDIAQHAWPRSSSRWLIATFCSSRKRLIAHSPSLTRAYI